MRAGARLKCSWKSRPGAWRLLQRCHLPARGLLSLISLLSAFSLTGINRNQSGTLPKRQATQPNDRPQGAVNRDANRHHSSGRRRSPGAAARPARSAQSAQSVSDGHESTGTLPTDKPSPAPDHRRHAGRDANRRFSDDDRGPSPGAVAQSAQSAQPAQSAGSAGYGLLRVLQTATKTTGPGHGGNSRASDTRKRPANLSHWDSGYTPESAPAPAAAAPAAEPTPLGAEAAAAAAAAGDEYGGGDGRRRRRRRTRRRDVAVVRSDKLQVG